MQFIDIQVNGAFGVDFNDDNLDLASFQIACDRLAETGVRHFFPTIITSSLEQLLGRIRRISDWIEQSPDLSRIAPGIHVEGPFLSRKSGFRGTHPEEAILPATPEIAAKILEAGQGRVKLLTLAPEMDEGFHTTEWLSRQGVIVFGGHSDATIDELRGAIDHGLQGFTHLGNGCVMEVHRHDNIINRVLACGSDLKISVIADAIHVPFWLLKFWLDAVGSDRLIVTSDSMSAAGMPPGEYLISGQPILVDPDRRTRHRDHQYLAGSASTMRDMLHLSPAWVGDDSRALNNLFAQTAYDLFWSHR